MKKILTMVLLLMMALCNVSFAAELPPQQDTNQLMTKFTEARFRLESGINYLDFQKLKQDLYVATKMYSENYPDSEFNNEFSLLANAYDDTYEIWGNKFGDSNTKFLGKDSQYCKALTAKYPELSKCGLYINNDMYYVDELVSTMFSVIGTKTKNLNQSIKEKYQQ